MIRTKVTQIAMVTMYCAAWLIMNELLQKQKAVGGPLTDEEAQALEDAILDIMAQDQNMYLMKNCVIT